MAKRKRINPGPTVVNADFPVMIPNEKGEVSPAIGTARLRFGTLVVEFKDTAPAVAIQRMMERGVLVGFGMIMMKPDELNEQYQDIVEGEELKKELLAKFDEENPVIVEERSDDADR